MISIIVPIYNAAEYVERCVTSLLRQTEQDLEIVLVDDGSTDGSKEIAQEMAGREARIRLLSQPHAGQSTARNLGMRHAQGEYIAFVDADDALEPDWCEQHLRAIEGVDYVQSGYTRVAIVESRKSRDERREARGIYQFTSPCMRLYRREAIRGMEFVAGMIYEDVAWSVDLWMRGLRCRRIAYCGYRYTQNPNSTTARRHPEAERRVFQELRQRRRQLPITHYQSRLIILYTVIRLKLHFLCRK